MNGLRSLLLAAAMAHIGATATLAVSTYLKDGFTPAAIASDSHGNIYLAGSAVIDAASQATSVLIAKLDPKATQYLYLAYLDSAASDQVSAIAVLQASHMWRDRLRIPTSPPPAAAPSGRHRRALRTRDRS
jgi:hypothetical protein